jgi:hypothetical protein
MAASGGMRELVDSSARLVELSVTKAGDLSTLEDAIPIDPRVPAVGVFRGRPYRLYPGMLERPLAALRTAELIAPVVDPVLRPELAFGVADYVEVCLMRSEMAVETLTPVWPSAPLPDVGALPTVTEAEVSAARNLLPWSALEPGATDAHRRALAWATVSLGQLHVNIAQGTAETCFGSALAVIGPHGSPLALPLPYIAEAWEHTVATLAYRAAGSSQKCRRDWLRIARAEVGKSLASRRDLPPAWIARGPDGPVMIIHFGHRHVIVLAVAADIGVCDTRSAESAVSAIVPGGSVRTDEGPFTVPAEAEIVRVVVAAPVGPAVLGTTEHVALVTLEDLQWILATCDRAHELWAFFHEQVVTNEDIRMFGWEVSNTWQFWKANGQALHRAGLPPTAIFVAPHQVGGEEWQEVADRAAFEWALPRLGLPPSRDLRAVERGNGPVKLLTADNTAWAVALLERDRLRDGVVLAEVHKGEVPVDVMDFASNLLGTAGFVALHDARGTSAALRECGLDRLVLSFEYRANSSEPISIERSGDDLRFTWNAELQELELDQPRFVQDKIGDLLTTALARLPGAGGAVQALASAWCRAPRMLVVSAHDAPRQHARDLRRPQSVPEWAVSQANRQLGQHLEEVGQSPGLRDRAASRTLELDIIVPWLRCKMGDQFGRFDRVAVLRRAAREIEAVAATRQAEQRQRLNRVQMPTASRPDVDADPRTDEDAKLAQHSATLGALLELALAADAGGHAIPDNIEWPHLLALARLFVDSTNRCDSLLHELSGETTKVSDRFEITVEPADGTIIDIDAFNIASLRHARGHTEEHEQGVIGPSAEEIFGIIDPAMLQDLRCSATTLMSTCAVISGWPATNRAPVADATFDELSDGVAQALGVELAEAQAAVNALTLTREGLIAESVQPWKGRARDYRLLARPVVELDDQTALLLPWNSETSGKVMGGYLSEGLLPWPPSRLQQYPTLRTALGRVRSLHTRVLEDQVDAELRRLGFAVRSRIKPQHARTIGLTSIPGEIDHIAARPEGGVLWVVDDKDPAHVFTAAELSRGVRQFFDEQKGEVPKLQAKVNTVANNVRNVASALRVPNPKSVRGLFVTRNPIPAAFTPPASVCFATLRELYHAVGSS